VILSSSTHKFSNGATYDFDLFINATGYEQRASALIRSKCILASRFISLLFQTQKVISFRTNLKVMQNVSATMIVDFAKFYRSEFRALIDELYERHGRQITVGMDVSSMNRTMIATGLSALFAFNSKIKSLRLFYVPSAYRTPQLTFSQIEQIGAVTPELSGFDSDPTLPICLVLGLGFEYGTAVGMINQLEPQFTLCLRAVGNDRRFETAVRKANLDFDFSGFNVEISEYELLDATSSYHHIENIVHSLVSNFRVVMVPMGPKVLAAIFILIALRYFGKIALWRVARHADAGQVMADDRFVTALVDMNLPSLGVSFDVLREMVRNFASEQAVEEI
jgi:hypothetical protein